MTGIYQIKSKTNLNLYIGSAINFNSRWNLHKNSLLSNNHHSIYLQRHCNKYGVNDLEFSIVELCNRNELIQKEQYYLDLLNPSFNVCKIANSSLGIKRRPETIEKIRNANLGLKHPEWRNKIKSKAQGGKNHWTKNKNFSKESKLKMSESQKKLHENGYKSPLAKKVIQEDLKGNFIKEWFSANQAVKIYGKGIQHNLKDKTKTAYGYKWRYERI